MPGKHTAWNFPISHAGVNDMKYPLLHFLSFYLLSVASVATVLLALPQKAPSILLLVALVQLFWGLVIFGSRSLSAEKLWLGVMVLVLMQSLQYLVATHSFQLARFAISDAVKYFIFVAFVEEIWFRGILHNELQRRFSERVITLSIVSGCIFGVFHINSGLTTIITTSAIGFVFAIARVRGAGIVSLTLAHGAMNWLNLALFPAVGVRFELEMFVMIFVAGCVVFGMALLLLPAKTDVKNRN